MKRIYTSDSPLLVGHMRNLLETEGIRCVTRNDGLLGGAGELPPNETWPELWVEREVDYLRAEQLVKEAMTFEPTGDPWTCKGCGEVLEAQFTECWQCGRSRKRVSQ